MSDENVVDILKAQHKTLDESVHSLVRAVADIKNIVLENRERLDLLEQKLDFHEQKLDLLEQKLDFHEQKLDLHEQKLDLHEQKIEALAKGQNALAEATLAGFKRVDEEQAAIRNDIASLELLIRQRFPEN